MRLAPALVPPKARSLVDRFRQAMAGLEPFEPEPIVAVAVSGGPDSLALTLLAANWALARGGRVIGLTVDHGLRAASAAEARWVGRVLERRGIDHRILKPVAPPSPPSQAAARDVRYTLLDEECRRLGILHLLVGHHLADQAETIAMRCARGSGPGTAGMAAVRELGNCRLLRPLLGTDPLMIRFWLRAQGLGWCHDPSNDDRRFERVRVRPIAGNPGLDEIRQGAAARARSERSSARWFAAHATLDAKGSISIAAGTWHQLSAVAKSEILRAATACIGSKAWPPRRDAADHARTHLDKGRRRTTLGGCLIMLGPAGLSIAPEHRATGEHGTFAPCKPLAGASFAAVSLYRDGSSLC
ncbi:MAG: tRNA lysidine(34) synthetase TilS [Geminicoccaceae bacterium]